MQPPWWEARGLDGRGACGTREYDIAVTLVAGGPWCHDVTGRAGDAVSADIEVSSGTVYPVTIADGWLMGWFGAEPAQTAVLRAAKICMDLFMRMFT